ESEPGAGLYVGFNKDVTREEVKRRVEDNTIMEIMNFYPTKPGDVFYIPAGTVHAIGAGNLICEIQQSSNVTYRLYDFDRADKFGNKRELHVEKALEVINYGKYELPKDAIDNADEDGQMRTVCRCKYFESSVYDVTGPVTVELSDSVFMAFAVVRGSGSVKRGDTEAELKAGETIFVPAGSDKLILDGKMTVLSCHI
ncbi:MAG: class I mannose-6-phosphate isomerase, partial [Clostridiales bacterium]|nr:class I mannose-6-phosphate isomerase [Clostridiales bacterium]